MMVDRTPPVVTNSNDDKASILSVINPILNTSTNVVTSSSFLSSPYVMISRGSDLKLAWSNAVDIDSGIAMYRLSLLTIDHRKHLYNTSDCWSSCVISSHILETLIVDNMEVSQLSYSFALEMEVINGASLSGYINTIIIIVNAPLFSKLSLYRVDTTSLSFDNDDAIASLINGTSISICSEDTTSSQAIPLYGRLLLGDDVIVFTALSDVIVDIDVTIASSSQLIDVSSTSLGVTSQIDLDTVFSSGVSSISNSTNTGVVMNGNVNMTIILEASNDIGSRSSISVSFITYNSSGRPCDDTSNVYDGVPLITNSTGMANIQSLWLSAFWDAFLFLCHNSSNPNNGSYKYEIAFGSSTGIDDIIEWTSLNTTSIAHHYMNRSIILTDDMIISLRSYASVPILASVRTIWSSSCLSSSSIVSIHRSNGTLLPSSIVSSDPNATISSTSIVNVVDTTPPVVAYIKLFNDISNHDVNSNESICQVWNNSLSMQWHIYDDESRVQLLWLAIIELGVFIAPVIFLLVHLPVLIRN
jgi:hypothetical protein